MLTHRSFCINITAAWGVRRFVGVPLEYFSAEAQHRGETQRETTQATSQVTVNERAAGRYQSPAPKDRPPPPLGHFRRLDMTSQTTHRPLPLPTGSAGGVPPSDVTGRAPARCAAAPRTCRRHELPGDVRRLGAPRRCQGDAGQGGGGVGLRDPLRILGFPPPFLTALCVRPQVQLSREELRRLVGEARGRLR